MQQPAIRDKGISIMRNRIAALICAVVGGLAVGPLTAVSADTTASVALMGSQHARQYMGTCYADFTLSEFRPQSPIMVPEPHVSSLTMTTTLVCSDGYPTAGASLSGDGLLASCTGNSPFNPSANTVTATCTIDNPPPGYYQASGTAYAGLGGWENFAWSFNEVVEPGVQIVPGA
jgi:hypothetical protein